MLFQLYNDNSQLSLMGKDQLSDRLYSVTSGAKFAPVASRVIGSVVAYFVRAYTRRAVLNDLIRLEPRILEDIGVENYDIRRVAEDAAVNAGEIAKARIMGFAQKTANVVTFKSNHPSFLVTESDDARRAA